jgi:hypothetical protein
MSAAHQLARALGAKRSGRQWVCRCPAHDDAAPSLIFWQGHSAIRFKCYSGCEPEDVIAALRRRGLLEDREPGRKTSISTPGVKSVASDVEEERERARKLKLAGRIWNEAVPIEGTPGALFLHRRHIDIALAPDFGGLRWHPQCLWKGGTAPCVVARYTHAITGEPRALGPMARCAIRLWPDDAITTVLVLGEGVETTLAAALHITHRETLLQPAWAAGCADNMANFPVLAGIETLTLLVDNDGPGQAAAANCACRWVDAGREVIRLTPRELGADFNDIIAGKAP